MLVLKLIFIILLWTFIAYWMHRLGHIKSRYNPIYYFHIPHHNLDYISKEKRKSRNFKWYYLFFYFGNIRSTLDVIFVMTIPLTILIYIIAPNEGLFLLLLHYIYEVFLGENILDHNPNLKGRITHYLAWGQTHLEHHRTPYKNYGLIINLWDYIFSTWKQHQKA